MTEGFRPHVPKPSPGGRCPRRGRMRGTPKGFEPLRQNEHSRGRCPQRPGIPPPPSAVSPLSQGGLLLRIIRLPCERPIPLVKGKCPEGTKGIGKVAPKGPDEGGYRWVRRPSNGRMGTSAPTQGYNRFRRGRCPQRPVDNGCTPVVPLIRHGCAMPPSPLRGEGYAALSGTLKHRWRSPHPSRLRRATFPQGKALGGQF